MVSRVCGLAVDHNRNGKDDAASHLATDPSPGQWISRRWSGFTA